MASGGGTCTAELCTAIHLVVAVSKVHWLVPNGPIASPWGQGCDRTIRMFSRTVRITTRKFPEPSESPRPNHNQKNSPQAVRITTRKFPPSRPNHNQKVPRAGRITTRKFPSRPNEPSESQPESSPRAVRITTRKSPPEPSVPPKPSESQPENGIFWL